MRKLLFVLVLAGLLCSDAEGQSRSQWVDSVFNTMDLSSRIAHLFMLSLSPGENDTEEWVRDIASLDVAGVIINRGPIADPAGLVRKLQSQADIPLLISMDRVGSPAGYIDSLFSMPGILMQGAVSDDSLIFALGREVGRQMKLTGMNVAFIPANLAGRFATAPGQAYSEDPAIAARKALAYFKGLQQHNIIGVARYFPVQSVSVTNVGRGLPGIQLTVDTMQTRPFRTLFREGVSGVMPAAIDLPLFYPTKKTALKNIFSSGMLSASFAGDWIRKNTSYGGLVIVDVQQMVRHPEQFKNGDAELFAFQAGNDVLITSGNINAAVRKIRRLVKRDAAYMNMLNRSVRKVLELKYDAGLAGPAFQSTPIAPLVSDETRILREKLFRAAVTVVANKRSALPIQTLENKKFTCVVAGDPAKGEAFAKLLSRYVPLSVVHIDEGAENLSIQDPSFGQHVLIAAVFDDAPEQVLSMVLPHLREGAINRDVIICDFGSSFLRQYAQEFETVVTAWTSEEPAMRNLAQAIFGAISLDGSLPVAWGGIQPGKTNVTPALDRLGYSFPEEVGIDSHTLRQIESIAMEAIETGATPGCQVVVARHGKVVYERAFGHLTYEKQTPVEDYTTYDLASVTKVAATLQAIMFLYEKGAIDIHAKASWYLPELKGSNKENLIIKDILTHQAGLWPYLPFWAKTMKDSVYLPAFYNRSLSREYSLVVADNLYASPSTRDSLWHWVIKARMREKADRTPYDYRYSDMGFYILHQLAERLLNQSMDEFLSQNFYEPMGAWSAGYRPLVRLPLNLLAPTENDRLFRKTLLIGTVHDQGAAMMGGVAGHAGLFSNANDLAKLGQMWLQEGRYGGIRYFKPQTIRLFTARQYETNRRGLGWDRPTGDWNGPTGIYASQKTFGHTGFTGTCVWVDPEFDLVYVFLSNRVHPDMTNNKLLSSNIRPRIQDVIYQGIFNYCKTRALPEEGPAATTIDVMGKAYNKK